MFAVHLCDVKAIEGKKNIEKIVVSATTASVLIDLDSKIFPMISEITFIDHELFNGHELNQIKSEVLKLKLNVSDQDQEVFLENILKLIDAAMSMNLWILFNPFYEY